eukprot:3615820-Amphidinium_carterae.1
MGMWRSPTLHTKSKGKGKGGKSKYTYDNSNFQPQKDKGKGSTKAKAKEQTSYATTVDDQDIQQTNARGKDLHTTLINQVQYGQYQTTTTTTTTTVIDS